MGQWWQGPVGQYQSDDRCVHPHWELGQCIPIERGRLRRIQGFSLAFGPSGTLYATGYGSDGYSDFGTLDLTTGFTKISSPFGTWGQGSITALSPRTLYLRPLQCRCHQPCRIRFPTAAESGVTHQHLRNCKVDWAKPAGICPCLATRGGEPSPHVKIILACLPSLRWVVGSCGL